MTWTLSAFVFACLSGTLAGLNDACGVNKFQCGEAGPCLRLEWRCDGRRQCKDGSDESPAACAQRCRNDEEFRCSSGQCVAADEKCDGIRHCGDGSDETPAACARECAPALFRCNGGQCVSGVNRCDGVPHCNDGSDEDLSRCAAEPSLILKEGQTTTAQLAVRNGQGALAVSICRGKACNRLLVRGKTSQGVLSFRWTTGCVWPPGKGWTCQVAQEPEVTRPLEEGVYTLVLERRPSQLAAWALEQPGHVGLVDAPEGAFTVRVRPMYWTNDNFRVKFETYRPPTCGLAPLAPAVSSVHGANVVSEAFPWNAAIYLNESKGHEYICGGTLIAPNVVVTAAHCVFHGDQARSVTVLAVVVGNAFADLKRAESNGVVQTKVAKVVALPLYRGDRRKYANDLAALLLETAASPDKMPVCLGENITLTSKDYLQVLSRASEGPLSDLMTFSLRYLPLADCASRLGPVHKQVAYVTSDKICAVRESDRVSPTPNLAKGSSGGGALVNRNGVWLLVGVVSVSLDGGNVHGFTDVRVFSSWLNDIKRNGTWA